MILNYIPCRLARLALITAVVTVLLNGLRPASRAQRGDQDKTQPASIPKVPVFKGSGGTATRATSRKLPPPPPPPQLLNSGFRNEIFKQLGGKPVAEYCKVTPQIPHMADKCFLDFEGFYSIRSNENMAIAFYQSGSPSAATFYIKPLAAGKKYLIDCAVHPLETQSLNVYGNFVTSPPFPASVSPTNNHLLLALEATDSHLYYLQIYKNDLTPFYFYGCTATEYVPQVSPSTIPK